MKVFLFCFGVAETGMKAGLFLETDQSNHAISLFYHTLLTKRNNLAGTQ
jgi:hypothetical protein